jgi:hypothetical protein
MRSSKERMCIGKKREVVEKGREGMCWEKGGGREGKGRMCWEERKGGSDPTKKRAFLWERRKERRSARASCSSPRGEASGRTRRAARARQRATDARPGEPLTMEGVVSQRDKSSKQSLSLSGS